MSGRAQPRLYGDLAHLWPLVSPPALYRDEAATVAALICGAVDGTVRTVLELGSGGGHLASHLRQRFRLTLVDRSAPMLSLSRRLNPGCTHRLGRIETIRLGRRFDAVLAYDAVSYLTSERALSRLFRTARAHLREGGVLLLGPDAFRETFEARTYRGSHHDGEVRLDYEERSYDPDPHDALVTSDFIFRVSTNDSRPRVYRDRHTFGLFARSTWLNLLAGAGFSPDISSGSRHRDFIVCTGR